MRNQPVLNITKPDPDSRRAGILRILANALLVLLAFEVVSLVVGMAQVVIRGTPVPVAPGDLLLLAVAFTFVRWVFVLPVLLPVLVGLELVGRRVPHARVLTAVVALAPMAFWQLTQASGDTSGQGIVLGLTAVLFAVLARLPAGFATSSSEARAADQPASDVAATPR